MLNFQNAEILSYSHKPQFLGDNLRYKITKDITINGYILNLPNLSGVSGVLSGVNTFLNGSTDYDAIFVNNVNFGQGKILDISFDNNPTNDVKYKKYKATFTVYDSGNLFNVLSGYYSGLNWNYAQVLDNFSENFSYALNDNGSSSYDQNISLRFNSGQAGTLPDTPIGMAKTFASGFFAACNLTGFLGINYNNNFKKFYTETYNLIDNSVSFKEHVDFLSLSGGYSTLYTHQLEIDENGIINVTENSQIKGLYDPLIQSALSGLAAEFPQSYSRCLEVYSGYGPQSSYIINSNPINKNVVINKFEGTVNYNVTYSDNPKYQNLYVWDYTTTIDRNEDRVYTIVENGKIVGLGRRNLDKYPNAISGYSIVKTGISTRASGAYLAANPYPLSLNEISSSEGRAPFEGTIGYSTTYTDDITLFPISGIKKYEFLITDKTPVQATNKFNIINFKEIIQPLNQSTLGQRDFNIKMYGARGTPLSTYLNYISGAIQPYKNLGNDFFLASCQYQFAPLENTLSMNLSYSYDGIYKQFSDIFYNPFTNITGNF